MSEDTPEYYGSEVPEPRVIDLTEGKSITGSAQTIGLEPGADYIPPTMALDSPQSEPDASSD